MLKTCLSNYLASSYYKCYAKVIVNNAEMVLIKYFYCKIAV